MKKQRRINGEGSLYQDKKTGKWRLFLKYTDCYGVKKRKTFTGNTPKEVKKKLEDFKLKELQILKNGADITLNDFAEMWLEGEKIHLKPRSFERKQQTFKSQIQCSVGRMKMNRITHMHVQNYVAELVNQGYSYSTIKKSVDFISECFDAFSLQYFNIVNPAKKIKFPPKISDITSNVF